MLLFLLAACLIAKIRRYRIAPVWRDYSLYPLYAVECAYWVFQGFAFAGDLRFVAYSQYLQKAVLLSLVFPILRHRLYARAIVGTGMTLLGTAMNRLVIAANGGRMPVYPTLSRLTGYFDPGALESGFDSAHALMNGNTPLRLLGDYIDVGFSIMSPGDLLIHGFSAVVFYGAIKSLNKCKSEADGN
jgi:hypothetical protein